MMKRRKGHLVGICLPTNNPDRTIFTFAPTLEHIKELGDVALFLIHFQPPWKRGQIRQFLERLEEVGFNALWTCSRRAWSKPIKMIRIRGLCAALAPEIKYYMFVDDDFRFSGPTPSMPFTSGQRYLQVIDYLERMPYCGVVNVKGFLGGKTTGTKIVPAREEMIATGRGTFFRNMHHQHGFSLYFKECLGLVGGLEETLAAYVRVELGYWIAKQMNNPTVHWATRVSSTALAPDDMHNPTVYSSPKGVATVTPIGTMRERSFLPCFGTSFFP